MRRDMFTPHDFQVAFLGFSEFERTALASFFRLAGQRVPHYGQVQSVADADFLVADADHAPSVQLAMTTGRVEQTVFVGSHAPLGARAWLTRPIDAVHVMRELDAMVKLASGLAVPTLTEALVEPPPVAPPPLARPSAAAPASAPATPTPAPTGAPHEPGEEGITTVPGVLSIFTDPTAVRPPAPRPPARKRKSRAPPAADAPLPTALLVDDSPVALRFLETRLVPWGLKVDCARDSRQALEFLEQRSYGFAFLDIELGEESELDGLALCQHIKQSPASLGLTVIMVSAHHSELDRVRGNLAGCDGYLGKPLDEGELARLLLRQGLREPAEPAGDAA